jgi:hypothetical protein
MSSKPVSASVRRRGRGGTAEERKNSRAAFRAWDTRRAWEAAERKRRKKIAEKAAATRRANANK